MLITVIKDILRVKIEVKKEAASSWKQHAK